jgi:DNA-directed RNA polymerase subunit RPC12/RpoP
MAVAAQHACPYCRSAAIARVRRHRITDYIARVLRWRVYRCRDCGTRFYDRPLWRRRRFYDRPLWRRRS